jgi:ElaB/YqjD/DUF883 family membrane-anchored ribosome-binding protein
MNNITSSSPEPGAQEGLARNLHQMVDEADRMLKSAAETGDAKFDAVRDKFVEQLRRMRLQLDELQESAVHKARHAARTTDLAVHQHPYSAMGVAAALGLLIGFLVARR